jgi:hypothetical protein
MSPSSRSVLIEAVCGLLEVLVVFSRAMRVYWFLTIELFLYALATPMLQAQPHVLLNRFGIVTVLLGPICLAFLFYEMSSQHIANPLTLTLTLTLSDGFPSMMLWPDPYLGLLLNSFGAWGIGGLFANIFLINLLGPILLWSLI